MTNKEIQQQRMRGYFIQAAKEMLKGEGLKSISTRKIASQAGYSYATLYNYFKDIKDLIFECVKDFQDEAAVFVQTESKAARPGIEKIKAMIKAYIKYFVQYPGTFELFFLERMSEMGSKQKTSELIYTFLDRLLEQDWNYCIENKILEVNKAANLKDEIRYVVSGLLLFYINRRQPASYTEFETVTNRQLNHIFDR